MPGYRIHRTLDDNRPAESQILESSARRNSMDARILRPKDKEFRVLMLGSRIEYYYDDTGEFRDEKRQQKKHDQELNYEVLNKLFD